MYQRAVKVAPVMEENKRGTQALNLEGWKREFPRQTFPTQSDKRFQPDFLPERGKQLMYRPPSYPTCKTCGKHHSERCLCEDFYCYECGHRRSEVPKLLGSQQRVIPPTVPQRPPVAPPRPPSVPPRPPFAAFRGRPPMSTAPQRARNNRKPQIGGPVYCLEAEDEGDEDPHAVVSGTFVVNTIPVKVLFNPGATHSFINPTIAAQMTCVLEELKVCLCVSTPIGSTYQSELVARNCVITI